MTQYRSNRGKALARNGRASLVIAAAVTLFVAASALGAGTMLPGFWLAAGVVVALVAVAMLNFRLAGRMEQERPQNPA